MSDLAPPPWTGMLIGSAAEGSGTGASNVSIVLGDAGGPVGAAWTAAMATSGGPFLVHNRPGVAVRPFTVFVPVVESDDLGHAEVTWGAAHAGVAAAVSEAVRSGVIPADVAETALLVCSVWVDADAGAADADAVFRHIRTAAYRALENAGHQRPTVADALRGADEPWNPFHQFPNQPS